MPRCDYVPEEEADNFREAMKKSDTAWWMVEPKASSIGRFNDRLVAIDFGSTTIDQQERRN